MSEELSTLELGVNKSFEFKVHPSVPLAILEYYYRKKTSIVVGTLLGIIMPNHIEITNCYAVPIFEYQNEDNGEREVINYLYFFKLLIFFNKKQIFSIF